MGNVLDVQWPSGRVGLPVKWTGMVLPALCLLWLVSFTNMTARIFYRYLVVPDVGSVIFIGAGLLVLAFGILHFAKTLYRQIFPGPLRIIAVAIVNTRDTPVGRVYEFIGAGKRRTWGLFDWLFGLLSLIIPLFALLTRLVGVKRRAGPRPARALFKKNAPPLLYLDQARQIAIAAQTTRGGAVVLIDEELTHLRLPSEQDRQLFLMSLRSLQAAVARNPERLQAIMAGIEERELVNQSGKKQRARQSGPVTAAARGR